MKRKIKYKDGSVYEGEVNLLGKPNGKGVMTYFWGGVYEGEWKDGKPHGFGKYIYDDGTVFEGSWNMGIEDTGTLTSPNGDIYTGKMRSSDEVVMGVMTYADGEVYDGEWLGTKRHGKGVLTKPDGSEFNVTFEDDRLISSVQTRAAVAPKDEPVPAPSGELENALEKIVKEFGVPAFRREGNAAAVLSDILPGDKNAKLRRRINNAVESGACDCLINGGSDRELLISEAVSRLINYTDMADDTARETIEALAAVLL